ncbi:MAG: hypothetical protein ACYTEQ_17855 [Planctomycetota bacterium]
MKLRVWATHRVVLDRVGRIGEAKNGSDGRVVALSGPRGIDV